MQRPDRPLRIAVLLLIPVAATLGPGCSRVLGPVPMPVVRVQGVIREGARPISGGWVEFMPCGGTVGNLRSARIAADGTFDADRVAVGENAIRVVNDHVQNTPPLKILGTTGSPIRRVIGPESPAKLTIDLRDEALRFQEFLRRRAPTGKIDEAKEEGP
jgi:hypothetical protein